MQPWVIHAVIAMVSITAMMVLFKELTDRNISTEIINLYFFLFTTVAIFFFVLIRKTSLQFPVDSTWHFIALAAIAVSYNYYNISAIKHAPNAGYAEAIVSFRFVALAIIMTMFHGAELTIKKIIGMILVFIGIILVGI